MVILLPLFPHYCDDFVSRHPMPCSVPRGASPYPLGDLMAQFWPGPPTTHAAITAVHMLSPALKFSGSLQRGLRTGWEKHEEGGSTQFLLLFLCSVVMTPPYLLLLRLMARWTSPKVWCHSAALSIYTKTGIPPVKLEWPVLGKKRQKGEKKTKKPRQKWKYVLEHNYGLSRQWLFSLKGLLRSSPLCPFPLLTDTRVCYVTGSAQEPLFADVNSVR